jgi:PIN domain nuclease of toxin-antitoxin system
VRLLLDTHVLLWWLTDDPELPDRAAALVADRDNEVFVSSISVWEIALKSRLGKLRADVDDVVEAARRGGLRPLPFTLDHAAGVRRLPQYHRDPFDRALLAQALTEPLHLLTHDERVSAYGEHVLFV